MQSIRRILIYERRYLAEGMFQKRNSSTTLVPRNEFIERSNYLFDQEKKKKLEQVGRIEKIRVQITEPENITVVMNQDISTPYDCCKHISEGLCLQTPLALVNNEILWDMHRPLSGSCSLKFLSFKDEDPFSLNKVFWRTGSFILGAVISRAFKDDIDIHLHSFPHPYVKSGSFVYDTILNINSTWEPTKAELKVLSAEFISFTSKNLRIDAINVKKSVALEMFEGRPVKQSQISSMADLSPDKTIRIYRVGDHIDMSRGPMVADTSFFGRSAVASVHRVHNNKRQGFYRFQGVALPKGILLNSFAFDVLLGRAERLNEAHPPGLEKPEFNEYGTSNINPPNSKIKVNPHLTSVEL